MKVLQYLRMILLSIISITILQLNANAQSIGVKDSLQKELILIRPAKRIVSLSPQATEVLFAINGGQYLVGNTDYCDFPEQAKKIEKVGGFIASSISIEKIVSLKPDLVLDAGKIHKSIIEALGKLKIPTYSYEPETFTHIAAGMVAIGKIIGNEENAKSVAQKMIKGLERIRDITAKIKDNQKPRVFYEVYDNPLMTSGTKTFIHQIITYAGGVDIFNDVEGPWAVISAEEVVKRNPDYIIAPDNNAEISSAKKIASRPGWRSIKAVKNNNVFLVNGDILSRATPRVQLAVEQLVNILHPNIK